MSGVGVYVIEHVASGRKYVGSSVNVTKRWAQHRRELGRGAHINEKLQRAWLKYGAEAFVFSLVEAASRETNLAAEQRWLDTLNCVEAGFNISPVAGRPSGRLGRPHTEATKALIRAKRALQVITPEAARKQALAITGRPRSAETRAKISAGHMGKVVSDVTRAKIRAANLGKRKPRYDAATL